MNQHQFEQLHQPLWDQFDILLSHLEKKSVQDTTGEVQPEKLPEFYRSLCNHYGLARARQYSPALVDRLHELVSRGYNQMYREKRAYLWQFFTFITRDFPCTLRKYQKTFWLACVLFYLPALSIGFGVYHDSSLIFSVMPEEQVYKMESMYDSLQTEKQTEKGRHAESDFAMFGYYILNNISIGFRTFAGGILFGIGSIFILVFNGVTIGAVFGHLSHPPFNERFWQFVAGHGAFELTAIVICGTAGLRIGYSLLHPGQYSRSDSLRGAAPEAIVLVIGAALMLVVAAFIEAFWSSSGVTSAAKYWVGGGNWLLVIGYFLLAGRGNHGS